MDDLDFDASLLDEVFDEVETTAVNSQIVSQPGFLTDIAESETNSVLGKQTPVCTKKKHKLCANAAPQLTAGSSVIHKGDTDSSDDEDNRYFEDRRYSDYGNTIKELVRHGGKNITTALKTNPTINLKKWKNELKEPEKPEHFGPKTDVLVDPVLNMRITNPTVSSVVLKERMIGRKAVSCASIKSFLSIQDLKDFDWVTGGVITAKTIRTSQKGNQYCIWNLTDLHGDIKVISVFLFGGAYSEFWKTAMGSVVGILNAVPMESKDSRTEATLKVDNGEKIMVFGIAKDFGYCQMKKKNGEMCTSIVNKGKCGFCVYHLKQAYGSASKRTELQSACAGRGLNALRNKVLGKNEVFYGGKSFAAVTGKKSEGQVKKDGERLKKLAIISEKDAGILNKLNACGKDGKEGFEKDGKKDFEKDGKKGFEKDGKKDFEKDGKKGFEKDVNKEDKGSMNASKDRAVEPLTIDLDAPISKSQKSKAKSNALNYVRKNGPITTGQSPRRFEAIKRKVETEVSENKKPKLETPKTGGELLKEKRERIGITEEFLRMMNSSASNEEMLKQAESEEQEKYFNKLELREQIEDKMLKTFKVDCKAVRCLKCNYKSFSASDLCKKERHPLKVVNAVKRFWKCGDCGSRTVCLELVPLHSCKNCGSGKWERGSMLKEKKGPNLARDTLSIRGHEEKHIGAQTRNPNLNLLVPETV